MPKLVTFPTVHLAIGCLMVRADVPLRLLHAAALSLGIPRGHFYRGSSREGSLPRYVLNRPMIRRCAWRFGPMAATPEAESQAVDACFRPRRARSGRAAAK